ncbi:MAG: radical SAM peptide maturase [Alistipes sp.]|nr:radical SAM peptide maturase [Alistipes sp.]
MNKTHLVNVNPFTIENNIFHLENLVFEVTDACNLNCRYCSFSEFYTGYDERQGKFLSFDIARKLIDHLAGLWKNNGHRSFQRPLAVGFYGGEPLLNLSLIREIVDYMQNLDIPRVLRFGMTTNAMLLDRSMDYLVEKQFDLLISLDGDRESNGHRVDHAGNNSHDRVMANIFALREKYPEYFDRHVRFNSVLHNKNSVESIHKYIYGTFGKSPSIGTLSPSGIRADKREEFRRTYKNKHYDIRQTDNCGQLIENIYLEAPEVYELGKYVVFESGNGFRDYNDLMYDRNVTGVIPTVTCTPFTKKMFLSVNGKILPCEKIDHVFAMGNVDSAGVNLDSVKIAELFNGYLRKFIGQCSVCDAGFLCPVCIFHIDNVKDDNVNCPSFITTQSKTEAVKEIMENLKRRPHFYKRILVETTFKV